MTSTTPADFITNGATRSAVTLLDALQSAGLVSFQTVKGGATLASGQVGMVLDGSTIALPAHPGSGSSACVVYNAHGSVSVLVSPNGADEIAGTTGVLVAPGTARAFTITAPGTNWSIG